MGEKLFTAETAESAEKKQLIKISHAETARI
jgi:hypothetical protein